MQAPSEGPVTPLMLREKVLPDPIHSNSATVHPDGLDPYTVTQHFTFSIGSVIENLWLDRFGSDRPTLDYLRKAKFFLDNELNRREQEEFVVTIGH